MGKSTTKTIAQQADLNNRQILQIRTNAAREASTLLTRLTKFAAGDENVEMTNAQIKAAEIVLRKSVPDLSAMAIVESDDHSGESREELTARIEGLLDSNPKLLEVSGLMTRIALAKTVSVQEPEEIIEGEVIPIEKNSADQ